MTIWVEEDLRAIGVANAHEVVENQLAHAQEIHRNVVHALNLANEKLANEGIASSIDSFERLEKATWDDISAFIEEANISGETAETLALYALKKETTAGIDITNPKEIEYLYKLAKAAGIASDAIAGLASVESEISNAKAALDSTMARYGDAVKTINVKTIRLAGDREISDAQKRYNEAIEKGNQLYSELQNKIDETLHEEYTVDFSVNYNGGDAVKDALAKDAKDAEDTFDEIVDFFERRVTVLNDAINLLDKNMENLIGAFAKNKLIDRKHNVYAEMINNYTDALAMYTEKANEVLSTLPDDIAQKARDGAVSLQEFIGEANEDVVDAINDYESWADKVQDCKEQLAELKTTLRQLELDKFNNVIEDFTNQFDLRQSNGIELIDKQIELFEAAGQLIGESFYSTQKSQAEKQLDILNREKSDLVDQLNEALINGVEAGTDEWLEMVNALTDLDGKILDCKKSVEEFDNAILEINWKIFERIQDTFSNINDEISDILDLIGDDIDVADDTTGEWTTKAITKLGLYAQQYEIARNNVQEYDDAIAKLNADYKAGRYSAVEYADKLAELSDQQREAAKTAVDMEDAIMSLNEKRIDEIVEGIEAEIQKYKELTDAAIDALDSEKDLHDYEKSISEKTKAVSDLQRQIKAMENDTTASSIAKRKKLEEKLAEALEDLHETEYDHSIEQQKEALQQQYEDYEDARNKEIEELRATLNDRQNILFQSFEAVKQKAVVIGNEIRAIAVQHGIDVSDAITSAWFSGEKAIASYGQTLDLYTSQFISNITGVKDSINSLQELANSTADSLSNMFSVQADNLVNELTESYNSIQNLQNMTNALNKSFVNTLERGYEISSSYDGGGSGGSVDSGGSEGSTVAVETPKTTVSTNEVIIDPRSIGYGVVSGEKRLPKTEATARTIEKFAAGVRKTGKDQVAITQEEGDELIVNPDGSIRLPDG